MLPPCPLLLKGWEVQRGLARRWKDEGRLSPRDAAPDSGSCIVALCRDLSLTLEIQDAEPLPPLPQPLFSYD